MHREFSPMNAAELMDRVVDVYKKSFGKQIAFAAIVYAVAFFGVVFLTIALAVFLGGIMGVMGGAGLFVFGDTGFVVIIGLLLAIIPVILVWQAFSSSGHILLSKQAFYGHKVKLDFAGIFNVFLCVFSVLVAQIILSVPFVAAALGTVFVFVYAGFADFPVLRTIGFFVAVFVVSGAFLVYSNIFSLSVAVAVFERRYFFGAIGRGWLLVKPEFWRILGIRLLWWFVALAFSLSAQGVFAIITLLWDLIDAFIPVGFLLSDSYIFLLTTYVGPALVSLAVAPLSGIMEAVLYFNRRIKTEGLDLEIRLEKLS
ncbi:MAG: hypothetical protein FWB96_01970 [Defluviitaleaceae bacterium]|nr:hypothetical protein [Defluviitaleaceae bacterium]MCL2262023.1 hypothetical protein [Defluviitaleaceae bacterium]